MGADIKVRRTWLPAFFRRNAPTSGPYETTRATAAGTSKREIGLVSKKTAPHVHQAFLQIALPSLHNYYVK